MFVSPSHAARLQAPGISGLRKDEPVSNSDSTSSSDTARPEQRVQAFTHSVSNVEFDSEAKRVIVRQIHASSGTVLSQYPNEAQLRIRDYIGAAEAAKGQFISEQA